MALFESLSSKLQEITAKMRGQSRVTEADIKTMMREIRLALLEADVNYRVVKDLVTEIGEKCKGADVMDSLTPGQQVIKIVHESLIDLLDLGDRKLAINSSGFTVIMLYGLQGSGKTTTAAKLARILKQKGKRPLVTSVDTHRPAAAKQLQVLCEGIDIPSYIHPEEPSAVVIAREGVDRAKYLLCDTLIVDTAGRMTIDEELMTELDEIARVVQPDEKLLVVDAMIGQESVNIAEAFEARIGLSGFIMTKLDGDARGGAALSISRMTGKPIKFIGVGEKVDALEEFFPDRMASRILGMGDVLSLIEKATQNMDAETMSKTMDRLQQNKFTLQDMLDQLLQMKKMGSLKDLIGMLPGLKPGQVDDSQLDDRLVDRNIAILRSMTVRERENPKLLNASRRKRIAAGSGTTVQEVNRIVKQYEQTSQLMKSFGGLGGKGGKRKGLRRLMNLGRGGFPF